LLNKLYEVFVCSRATGNYYYVAVVREYKREASCELNHNLTNHDHKQQNDPR